MPDHSTVESIIDDYIIGLPPNAAAISMRVVRAEIQLKCSDHGLDLENLEELNAAKAYAKGMGVFFDQAVRMTNKR